MTSDRKQRKFFTVISPNNPAYAGHEAACIAKIDGLYFALLNKDTNGLGKMERSGIAENLAVFEGISPGFYRVLAKLASDINSEGPKAFEDFKKKYDIDISGRAFGKS